MAEQQDDKPRLPLTGIFALLAMAGSFLIYEGISLKTSRPIDKETPSHVFLGKGLIQSRLWQDPFEAVESRQFKEEKPSTAALASQADPHTLHTLIEVIRNSGIQSGLRVVPVFVDGSPYVNGVESRLKDRYAMVSALGAAGYVPESGEFIRVFRWSREKATEAGAEAASDAVSQATLIPVEFFIPRANLRDEEYGKHVLVVWLKDQDFGLLDDLLAYLDSAFNEQLPLDEAGVTYRVLGPRSSTTLSAMLKMLQRIQSSPLSDPPFLTIKDIRFYSPWATAEDTFLLDYSPWPAGQSAAPAPLETEKTVDELFAYPRIEFTRTIKTDALLAEELLQELRRREIDLKPCAERHCNPKVALISEWDTLYGRALPRTFAAVAMNNGSGETGPALKAQIDRLRRDEWPGWIYTHSYLAGLDGELPAKDNDEPAPGGQSASPSGSSKSQGLPGGEQNAGQRPEGRSQLDYVLRLATALKQEEARNGEEFRAIGILGSDIYDKLLLLQALRQQFPGAVFFTTDLNARLAWPGQWQWTRNVIIASHYGLELHPRLQAPIPPFRDGYQTSLFYTALWALDHFVPAATPDCPDCFRLRAGAQRQPEAVRFSGEVAPRLYEVGRGGAFDISVDKRPASANATGVTSVQPPRPDMERWDRWSSLADNPKGISTGMAIAALLVLAAMLLSSTVIRAFIRLASNRFFWLGLAAAAVILYGLFEWMRNMAPNATEAEPFVLTEGISAWPTAAIRLLALVVALVFLAYSWWKLKKNENILGRDFKLDHDGSVKTTEEKLDCPAPGTEASQARAPCPSSAPALFRRIAGLHFWPLHAVNAAKQRDAARLWQEYAALGTLPDVAARCLPQVALALLFAFLTMKLLGFPNTPCRGEACFELNHVIVMLGVGAMTLLIFFVIDVIRLCCRWVNCIGAGNIAWRDETLTEIAMREGRSIGGGQTLPGGMAGHRAHRQAHKGNRQPHLFSVRGHVPPGHRAPFLLRQLRFPHCAGHRLWRQCSADRHRRAHIAPRRRHGEKRSAIAAGKASDPANG
jgi:hypothetical protein